MHTIGDVAGNVGEVHEEREPEVLDGLLLVANFGCHDALDAGRERRVARRERVVVGDFSGLASGVNSLPSKNIAITTSACLSTWWR